MPANSDSAHLLRVLVLAVLLLGLFGTSLELLLLEHTEDYPQLIPFAVMTLAAVAIVAALARPAFLTIRALQLAMAALIVAGAAGLYFHYSGNAEFELEMYPDAAGLTLLKGALMGATPALAPGTLIQFGLVGLATTFRHPALARARAGQQEMST